MCIALLKKKSEGNIASSLYYMNANQQGMNPANNLQAKKPERESSPFDENTTRKTFRINAKSHDRNDPQRNRQQQAGQGDSPLLYGQNNLSVPTNMTQAFQSM